MSSRSRAGRANDPIDLDWRAIFNHWHGKYCRPREISVQNVLRENWPDERLWLDPF